MTSTKAMHPQQAESSRMRISQQFMMLFQEMSLPRKAKRKAANTK
jgi:hypothetical protein